MGKRSRGRLDRLYAVGHRFGDNTASRLSLRTLFARLPKKEIIRILNNDVAILYQFLPNSVVGYMARQELSRKERLELEAGFSDGFTEMLIARLDEQIEMNDD